MSTDFPVTTAAYRKQYGGTPPRLDDCCEGSELFVARMNYLNGELTASSFSGLFSSGFNMLGSSSSHVGRDGSVYLVSSNVVAASALHLTPTLSQAIYSTALPPGVWSTDISSDGSLLFAGTAMNGVPVTENAYRKQPNGAWDVFAGRLDPSGVKLQYATYLGTRDAPLPQSLRADRDGGAWLVLGDTFSRVGSIMHINSDGSKILKNLNVRSGSLHLDAEGSVHLFDTEIQPTQNALVRYPCKPGYARLSPDGEVLFASYLPNMFLSEYSIDGRLLLVRDTEIVKLSEASSSAPHAGCIDDWNIPLGDIVSIYGTGLGPHGGVTSEATNNQLPTELAGTRVLFYGQLLPVLYVSDTEVKAVLPFTALMTAGPVLRVERGESSSDLNSYHFDPKEHINLLTVDGKRNSQAVAFNEDGTLNSIGNPARLGSVVTFYGTGGGQTDPPSRVGEVVPPNAVRRLLVTPRALGDLGGGTTEFAGVAPGQVSVVSQIKYRLPATLRRDADPNAALILFDSVILGTGATIAVK